MNRLLHFFMPNKRRSELGTDFAIYTTAEHRYNFVLSVSIFRLKYAYVSFAKEHTMAKTVIGLFDSTDVAQDAVQELVDSGFTRDHISLVSQESEEAHAVGGTHDGEAASTGAVGGTVLGGALGLLVGAGLLVIPGIGPILAAGPIAAAIGTTTAAVGAAALGAGLGAATGGLVGALIGEGIPDDEAQYYAEGVRRGGRLVLVQADGAEENQARIIMQRHGAADIHERAEGWRTSGWDGKGHTGTAAPVQDEVQRDWEKSSKVGTAVGTATGAATGAAIGSVAGPVGTVVGGVVGAATGAGAGAAGDAVGKHSEHASNPAMATSSTRDASANDFETYDASFRNHYQSNYATSGYTYDQYAPHYRYGYDLAKDARYVGRDWSSIEPDLHNQWSERNGGNMSNWEQFKNAVRYAWDQARGAV